MAALAMPRIKSDLNIACLGYFPDTPDEICPGH
jgi:hypothetical protein